MERSDNLQRRPLPEDDDSGFDIMEWVSNFLAHWYLFIIGLLIAFGLSFLQNRKWLPVYKSTGSVIIDDSRSVMNSAQVMMQGFGIQDAYRNVNNQVIMLGSYDLLGRVVDSLPQLKIDYINKGPFKVRNLYGHSPVRVHADYVSPEAFGILFKLSIDESGVVSITEEDEILQKGFMVRGRLGESLQHNLFFLTIMLSDGFYGKRDVYFRFRSRESLIADFSSRLRLNYVMEGASVLEISLSSETPARDVDFINMLCEVYLKSNLERKNDAAIKTISFIDEQLSNVSDLLSTSEDELTTFRMKNQIIDVGSFSGDLIARANSYDNEINQLKLKKSYLDYLISYIKTNFQDGSIIAPSSLGLNEPMLMALVQQINELIMKRSELPEKSMFHARYTREIETLKNSIDEIVKNMQATMAIQRQDIDRRLAEVQHEISQLPAKELEMIGIERRYRMNDSYYTLFLQKRAEAEILKASNTPDNNILDRARVINVINSSDKPKTTMMFLLLGLVVPAGVVIIKMLLNVTVRTNRDVERFSAFPLIGIVRHTRSQGPYIVSSHPRSSFTEMFRIIRTRLEFITQRKTNIAVMVTSSESGDGKTYFSINLACVYALASERTLLVDLDIRKPSIHSQLGVSNVQGLTNYLAGQCKVSDILTRPEGAAFDLIPAGTIPPNAGELVRSDKLASLFKELRETYDFIIVDTSPIGVVADAYAFAGLTDVNLFIIRSNKTHKLFLRTLTAQLRADDVHSFYSILNDVEMKANAYSRYYSRKYAYGNSRKYGNQTGYAYGYGYGYGYGGTRKKKDDGTYLQYYQDDEKDI
jgi:tyrosine-protein kinase Etk/Wzc